MNLHDYQEMVKATANYPKEFGLGYLTLGLMGEYQRFLQASTEERLTEKFGSVCWFTAALCKEVEMPFLIVFAPSDMQFMPRGLSRTICINTANRLLGEIAEMTKDHYKGENYVDFINLSGILCQFSIAVCRIASDYGVNVEEALQDSYDNLTTV